MNALTFQKNYWSKEVKSIRSFMDENYTVTLPTKISVNYDTDYQFGWAKIGVDKFCDRIIPQLRGDTQLEEYLPKIKLAIYDAVTFGNSTIIISPSGKVRVSVPEYGSATTNAYGDVEYTEEIGGFFLKSFNGVTQISEDGYKWESSEHVTFTIFYKADGAHPYGRSRITNSIRKTIKSASRAKLKAEIASNYRAYPMMVFSGLWDELADGVKNRMESIKAGLTNAIGLPKDPMDGQKIDVHEVSAADFTPFINLKESYAKDVAACFNIDPNELGAMGQNQSSADALYAAKEDLILEITSFESEIIHIIKQFFEVMAAYHEVDAPFIVFAEPATPSKASQADAFVKLASVIPQLKYSPAALQWAGLPNSLITDINAESEKWEKELTAENQEG